MEKIQKIVITQYNYCYMNQVIYLIGDCLVDQKILTSDCLPIEDDDLHRIEKVYVGRGNFWIALLDNVVVGTVGIQNRVGTIAKLKRMFIKKEFRGTGLGQQMLEIALLHAKEKGYIKITLNTHKNMKRAHHFYEKNGFVFVKKTGETMLTYERNL